jgi:uncharacterized protein YcbK (DUF882 family)
MMFLAEFQNRLNRRFAALLVTASIVLAAIPARAENEVLSLAISSDARTGRMGSIDGFTPRIDPIQTLPKVAQTDVPYVKVRLERLSASKITTINLPLNGQVGPDEAKTIAFLFRCRRTGRQRSIAPGVLALLADVATHWPDRPIQIVSGFRAPPFGAPHSKHFKGQAIDLRIPGVRTAVLRDYIWREHHEVGVGFYQRENFVHMDSRPGEQDSAWTGSDEGGPQEYNPRWAVKARRVSPSRGTMVASVHGLVGIGK